jgi:hypothetical protein
LPGRTGSRTVAGMDRELVDRYVAVWNEPDAAARRKLITDLWAEDGRHLLLPPEELRGRAAGLGLTATFEARGHTELAERARIAHENFVAPGEFRFRVGDNAARLHDVVKFGWEMVSNDGEVAAVGLEFLVLDSAGRIAVDYQFIER